jgi:antirestriction protein ArdC
MRARRTRRINEVLGRWTLRRVADRIIEELEAGVPSWVRPWKNESPHRLPFNARTGRRYRAFNIVALWQEASRKGYEHSAWLSAEQVKELGGRVKTGERPTEGLVWANAIRREVALAGARGPVGRRGTQSPPSRTMQLGRRVPAMILIELFNVSQIDGLSRAYYSQGRLGPDRPLRYLDAKLRAVGARVQHGGNHAWYSLLKDTIYLPKPDQFESTGHYFATSLHEHVHWTGHPARLGRTFGRYGDADYAYEEMVAEFGAAFLCALLGVRGRMRHASYIQSWIAALKADESILYWSTLDAEDAVGYFEQEAGGM